VIQQKLLEAGRVQPPGGAGSVVIIGESTSPPSQQRYARQTPGAVTVESVDLRDLVSFARDCDLAEPHVVQRVAEFAEKMMTNVGAADLVRRVEILKRGKGRKAASDTELAALALDEDRTFGRVSGLLVEINRMPGVRTFRPAVLNACFRALSICSDGVMSFHDAAVKMREQNRILGRTLPRRAVGSTLLLKGLEAEVAVLLCADDLNARHL
jgi:DNA helicase-2/ATP-dependent DNA helicase PcrA